MLLAYEKSFKIQKGNQKPYVEEQTIQGPKRKEKNRMTINNLQNTTQATKDGTTRFK